ncbi:hypothetical protein [Amycolatopsis sp. ATCC 39116]|uniref:hypothetical protein n=1 Tax=Amycolatopsis sp. (strain ATCC 39116 / 75iv2) TaxID=385957 RepID=UPI00026285E1|nr:hypothetical protein [Amycolatopsis sp. ATCC 39116]
MSWQDELRRLDAELANGTITQHQHRKMRDELLAAASGNVAPASVASPRGRVDGAPQWQSANPAGSGFAPQPGQAPWPQTPQGWPQEGAPQGGGPQGFAPQGWPQGQVPPGEYGQQPVGGVPQGPAGVPGQPQAPGAPGQQVGIQPQVGQAPAGVGQPQDGYGQVQTGATGQAPAGQPQAGPAQVEAGQVGQGQGGQVEPGAQPQPGQGQPQGGGSQTEQEQPQAGQPQAEAGHAQVAQGQPHSGQSQAGQPGGQPQAGQQQGGQSQPQGQQADQPQGQQQNQPQAGQSQSQPQGEQAPEVGSALATEEGPTQSISAQLLATKKPTSAPSPADERATDSMRFPSIEDAPTVVTNPVPPPARPLPSMSPPPPLHGPGQQLPFDAAPVLQAPPKRKPTWLFITLGVVVVLAMVAAGVWFLRGDNTTTTAQPTTSAVSSPEAVEARLPTLPGTPSTNNGTLTVEQGIDLKLYSREEGQLFKDNGANQVIFRGSSQGPQGYLVLVVPASSPAAAASITRGLYEHSLTAGLQTVPSGSTDAKAVTGSNSAGQMSGTWYTSGSYAVAIWVSQGLDGDPNSLAERLAQTKTSLATALPPN